MELILEWHVFKLHKYTSMWVDFFRQLSVLFAICSWEFVGANGWQYVLVYAILYRELEHLRVLLSSGVPATNPLVPRDSQVWGSQDIYAYFWQSGDQHPNLCDVQGSTITCFMLHDIGMTMLRCKDYLSFLFYFFQLLGDSALSISKF